MHLELPIASFIAAALSLAPLPWHWRAGTVPTIAIAIWLFVSNIINGVNTIIWAGNVDIVAPIWCDISTKIMYGANVAIPASIFCLCVHLERVSSVRQVSTGHAQKRRRQWIDAFICFGVPMIYMALHYIVQGHRFDLLEDFGCRPSIYVSVALIFLAWVPPLFFSLGAFVLSFLALRNFWIRRITFATHLQSSKSALTPSRYFRLMAMSVVQMFWGLAIIAFSMCFTMRKGLRPWVSWEDVHFNFSRVDRYPTILIPAKELLYTYMQWWTIPVSSVLFFAFFSFGQDAMKEYRACYLWVKHTIFRISDRSEKASISLPSYVRGGGSINLSPIRKHCDIKSEQTITSSAPAYKEYQWNPPTSPTSSAATPTYYASSVTDVSSSPSKPNEAEIWTDTQSVSSYCSTHKA